MMMMMMMMMVCVRVCVRAVYRYAFIRVVGMTDGLDFDGAKLISDLHALKLHTGVLSGSPNGARLKNNITEFWNTVFQAGFRGFRVTIISTYLVDCSCAGFYSLESEQFCFPVALSDIVFYLLVSWNEYALHLLLIWADSSDMASWTWRNLKGHTRGFVCFSPFFHITNNLLLNIFQNTWLRKVIHHVTIRLIHYVKNSLKLYQILMM